VFISVIICTCNRAASLRRTLDSFACKSNLGEANWELIIVDNNSGDDTPLVCREFVEKYPAIFRTLAQPLQGKSHAVNMGIAAAKGEVLALTDDDMLCDGGYIRGVRELFTRFQPDGAQGRILLKCEGGLPDWMHNDLAQCMGLRDYGDTVMEWDRPLAGGNTLIRADVVRRVGGYSREIGPGAAAGYAEDTEFSYRVRRAGCKLLYAPQVTLHHCISRDRVSKTFFRRRYFGLGRSFAYMNPRTVPLWRFGLYAAKRIVINEIESLWHLLSNHPDVALRRQCEGRETAGMFWQYLHFATGTPDFLSASQVGHRRD
jgi:GT2 family glycosyltransferase